MLMLLLELFCMTGMKVRIFNEILRSLQTKTYLKDIAYVKERNSYLGIYLIFYR